MDANQSYNNLKRLERNFKEKIVGVAQTYKLFEKSLTKNFIFCKRKFFYKWEAKS